MSRGNEGKTIFLDEDDCRYFLSLLEELLSTTGYLLYAWCVMGNHYLC
ncbi:MAG: hypothetical protein JW795_09060 [Chitinivibrionales bacterium]|nr:hypothetical protein [Chitinivibrionales bacterium]